MMTIELEETKKILLIDLENCPNQIKKLHENLMEFHKVVICYAHSEVKIPLDWLMPLNKIINKNRLEIFKMPNKGKNSADFGIAFLAGSLTQQYDKADYLIISNDKDLNHVVDLLKNKGSSAERLGKIEHNKTSNSNSLLSLVKEYCNHLIVFETNRPSKKETLLNSINSKFKDSGFSKDNIFQFLVENNVVSLSGKKTVYNNKVIEKLAES